jgi:hypothetical protein
MIMIHVFPELFNDKFPILRARACWVISKYSNLKYSNENLNYLIKRLLALLTDSEYIVQVQAAISISYFFQHEYIYENLKSNLGFLSFNKRQLILLLFENHERNRQ